MDVKYWIVTVFRVSLRVIWFPVILGFPEFPFRLPGAPRTRTVKTVEVSLSCQVVKGLCWFLNPMEWPGRRLVLGDVERKRWRQRRQLDLVQPRGQSSSKSKTTHAVCTWAPPLKQDLVHRRSLSPHGCGGTPPPFGISSSLPFPFPAYITSLVPVTSSYQLSFNRSPAQAYRKESKSQQKVISGS